MLRSRPILFLILVRWTQRTSDCTTSDIAGRNSGSGWNSWKKHRIKLMESAAIAYEYTNYVDITILRWISHHHQPSTRKEGSISRIMSYLKCVAQFLPHASQESQAVQAKWNGIPWKIEKALYLNTERDDISKSRQWLWRIEATEGRVHHLCQRINVMKLWCCPANQWLFNFWLRTEEIKKSN